MYRDAVNITWSMSCGGFIPELDFVLELGPVMAISEEEARQYDDSLEKMEKKYLPSQEEFYIMSHSFMK